MTVEAGVELDGQYRALREHAGVVDRSDRGLLSVRGEDAAEFLQGQLTNDIEALGEGAGCYAALLDRKGRLQADLRAWRLADQEVWLDTEPQATPTLLRHLSMYRVGRQVELDELSGERAILSVIGPAARDATGVEALPDEHAHRVHSLAGVDCRAIATDLGIDLICARSDAEATLRALADAGAVRVSEDAAEILRVETGRPRFGREMTTETIPEEAGINERAVSFTKGCYIGQETVARLHYKGRPNRHLRGLRPERPVRGGDRVVLGDREVGLVGTAVVSPAVGPLALAILRREAEAAATVAIGESGVRAEVVALPFE
jgi:tRNA-modifying protein YgfZ